jgi:branched-chain amino acid transport system permease protein
MDAGIITILLQDGLTNGAIYVLLALATIVVFSVTRITFIPQGDFVAFGALTLASLVAGHVPGTLWLLLGLGVIAAIIELATSMRRRTGLAGARGAALALAPGLLGLGLTELLPLAHLPLAVQIAIMLMLVVPLGPLLHRIVYQPLGDASVPILLITSAALHYLLAGLGLFFFGPEGFRTPRLSTAHLTLGDADIDGQTLIVLAATTLLLFGLYAFFQLTLTGKALRAAAANRVGARLMGIGVARAGMLAMALAAAIGAISGVLIGPLVTIFYDTGFGFGLRGFVAAIFGGLASYPMAAAGALFIGLAESFAAFYASEIKEAIVFVSVIPFLVLFSLRRRAVEE